MLILFGCPSYPFTLLIILQILKGQRMQFLAFENINSQVLLFSKNFMTLFDFILNFHYIPIILKNFLYFDLTSYLFHFFFFYWLLKVQHFILFIHQLSDKKVFFELTYNAYSLINLYLKALEIFHTFHYRLLDSKFTNKFLFNGVQ